MRKLTSGTVVVTDPTMMDAREIARRMREVVAQAGTLAEEILTAAEEARMFVAGRERRLSQQPFEGEDRRGR